jgi:hypothetical protein
MCNTPKEPIQLDLEDYLLGNDVPDEVDVLDELDNLEPYDDESYDHLLNWERVYAD